VNYPRLTPHTQLAIFATLGLVIGFLMTPARARWRAHNPARSLDRLLALATVLVGAFLVVQTEPAFEDWWLTAQSLGNRAGATYWMHLDLDIFCTHGVIWAQQKGRWGYQVRGEAEVFDEPADYFEQEHGGQRDFVGAVGAWLDDESRPHECRLETALPVMWAIFAALKSAKLGHRITMNEDTEFFLRASQQGRPIGVPAGVTDNDLKALRNQLSR